MKTSFTLFVFLFCFFVYTDAQHWALPSSRWTIAEFSPWSGTSYPVNFWVETDTMVQSVPCAKVASNIGFPLDIYTYLSGDTAYMFVNGSFKPMLYFGAHVGDTLLYYTDTNANFAGIPYLHGHVDSITTVSVNSQNLKQFHVSIVDSLPYLYPRQLSYTEELGFDLTYPSVFYQIFSSVVDADSYGWCNYGDSSISNFWLYPRTNCPYGVGITDISSGPIFDMYPNPVNDILHINTAQDSFHITISDMVGRNYSPVLKDMSIDLRELSAGVYSISFKTGQQTQLTRIFIKE